MKQESLKMVNKRTIHIAAGLHNEFKKQCVNRDITMKDKLEHLIIKQLSEWIEEEQKNHPFDIPNPYKK